MNLQLFLLLFFVLGIVYLILGIFVSRGIKNNFDYFLAGRKLTLWPLSFTLIATQVGGGMLLGTAAESYFFGYYGVFYTLGMSLGFLLLGCGFASKLRTFNISTTAELFEIKYKSPFLKKVASLLSALSLCGILTGQFVALKSLLYGIGIEGDFVLIGFWLFIVFYTMIGGLKAVVVTDTVQIIFLVAVFLGVFLYSLYLEPNSIFSLKYVFGKQSFFEVGDLKVAKLFPILFSPILFSLIEQDLGQRFFAAKNKAIAAFSAIISCIFMLLFAVVPIYFGMKARLMGIKVAFGASPLIPVIGNMVNDFVLALVICGLAAAITSTSDSLLCAISSNISQDFNFSFINEKKKLSMSKMITFFIGLFAMLLGYFSENIIQTLIISYELLISCLFVPILFCFFKKDLNKESAAFSIIIGGIGFVFFRFYPMIIFKEFIILFLSLLGYLVGDSIYRCRQR